MRHQNKIKKLGRTAAHRKATLAAMATALIEHKRIETTLPKAKALRSYVEPLINRAKEDTTNNRRQVFRRLQSKEAVKELFGDIASQIGDRPGGYTRVVKLGLRQGDAAEVAIIELVDYNDVKPDGSSTGKKKTRRSGGRRRKSADKPAASAPKAAASPKADASEADDLTKVWGVGPVFAGALNDAGITTFAQLAEADLDTLRNAIAEGSDTGESNANEETWAEQAAHLAAGDTDAHASYVEKLKDEGATAHHATEAEAEAAAEAVEAEADAAPPTQEAGDPSGEVATGEPDDATTEAPAAEAASSQSDDAPVTPSDAETMHPDTPQGAAPQTGEPAPETGEGDKGTAGGSQHRG